MLTSFIGVVILLGGLIFFHELGHYLVAKFFKVKVEVFSLGFGKKILRKTVGETEYTLSLIPLGGYVKLMGDDPYKGVPAAEAHRAFSTQKLYKRFLIVAAGPIANLLLAYVLYMFVFWAGQPMLSSKIGAVVGASPAWESGLRAKDRITQVAGVPVRFWNEIEDHLKPMQPGSIEIIAQRNNAELRFTVPVSKIKSKNVYGEDEEVGGVQGLSPSPLAAMVGVSNPSSESYVAGIRTGDVITKIGTQGISSYTDIDEALLAEWDAKAAVATVSVKRGEETQNLSVRLLPKPKRVSPFGYAEALGLFPSEMFVLNLSPGSPAEKGGLLKGDRIRQVNGTTVYGFETIVEAVQNTGAEGKPVALVIEREGKEVILNLNPIQYDHTDPLTHKESKRFMVGFVPQTAFAEADLEKFQIRNPVQLVTHSISEINVLAQRMVVSLVKLAVGDISVKNLGGPVLIASVAGKSLDAGIVPFLQMMALISINLFLLNLFPVPVLDGGHLLFFTIEALKGKPVSIRTMEIANQVGMVFILMLVGLTLFNDISRIVTH